MAKPPKCAVCKSEYTKQRIGQKVCSPKCAIEYNIQQKKKQHKAETRELKKKLRDNDKSYWMKKAQEWCNRYIRERDKHLGCCSCDKPPTWGGQWHASHYRPAGNNPALRFHPWNIQKGCSECNNFKSGNLIEYRIRLIDRIGIDAVEFLEGPHKPQNYTIEDYKEIAAYYREQV